MTESWRPAVELEAEARVTNAKPWEPLPGMVKRQCDWCRYFFAAPATSHEPGATGKRQKTCVQIRRFWADMSADVPVTG